MYFGYISCLLIFMLSYCCHYTWFVNKHLQLFSIDSLKPVVNIFCQTKFHLPFSKVHLGWNWAWWYVSLKSQFQVDTLLFWIPLHEVSTRVENLISMGVFFNVSFEETVCWASPKVADLNRGKSFKWEKRRKSMWKNIHSYP